jgi:nitroreductase
MLLDAAPGGVAGAARLGTYGVIRGAPCFLAGAVRDGPGAREDYGFALERIVLVLTGMGLATCWLAGTYRRGSFADRLALGDGEILPAVTPVGHPAARLSLTDVVVRAGAGSSRRRAWEELFPFKEEEAGPWAPCLEAVRLGPSATNGQPWRIAKEPGRPVFHLGLAGPAPKRSMRRLDAGIAMCHFALVAAELGLAGAWTAPDAAWKARHPLLPPGAVHVASWFPA